GHLQKSNAPAKAPQAQVRKVERPKPAAATRVEFAKTQQAPLEAFRRLYGKKMDGISTNAPLAKTYAVAESVFRSQRLSFGTNELDRSLQTLAHYLGIPQVRKAWLLDAQSRRALELELGKKIVPADEFTDRGNSNARIEGLLIGTQALSHAEKMNLLPAIDALVHGNSAKK
ncbi:MAG TPA: hypothetical protein VJH23_04925, partial [archaeon]|nr:hypothetical protein [archaeon]